MAFTDVSVTIGRFDFAEWTRLVDPLMASRRDETIAYERTRPSGLPI
jgi:hypothetical protein